MEEEEEEEKGKFMNGAGIHDQLVKLLEPYILLW